MIKVKNLLIIISVIAIFAGSISPIFAYSTGMSASVVIGQPDFTSSSANQGGSANANTLSILNTAPDITTDGTKLILSDSLNSRVLIYNKMPTSNNASADVVIGQA